MSDQIIAHLQAAAREVIAAARLALDMADEAVTRTVEAVGDATRPRTPPPPVEKIEVVGREEEMD